MILVDDGNIDFTKSYTDSFTLIYDVNAFVTRRSVCARIWQEGAKIASSSEGSRHYL